MPDTPTILLIENDEEDFRWLASVLRAQEFPVRVHWARGVGDAIAYLRGADGYDDRKFFPYPDLVLLDVATRLDAARETLVWMQAQPEFHSLPILVLSPAAEAHEAERAMAAGAAACFARPATEDRLRALFASIIAHWRKGPIGCHAPWPGAVELPAESCAA
jgi:CheY-like chemotaxis protein